MGTNNLASILHGAGTVFLAGTGIAALVGSRDPVPALIGFSCVIASWLLGGFSKTAVICRTFHSPAVERFLTTWALAPVSTFCKVVLIENEKCPDLERRYDVGALRGILCGALTLVGYWTVSGTSLPRSAMTGLVAVLLVDRAYFVLMHPVFLARNTIKDAKRLRSFRREIRRPSWHLPAKYVRHVPCLRHRIRVAEQYWFEVIVSALYLAHFVLIDVTEVRASPGLLEELRAVLQLISEGTIDQRKVMIICHHETAEDVIVYLDSQLGKGAVRPVVVGVADQDARDFARLWSRARVA